MLALLKIIAKSPVSPLLSLWDLLIPTSRLEHASLMMIHLAPQQ